MLKNKNIVLGVTGGIAAFKVASIISMFRKQGASVFVIMTKNAKEFISPLTLRSLSNNPVASEMFDEPAVHNIEHIALAKKADVFLIVPATANIIGKIANGIADDMLSTTVMATKAPIVIAPAMNTNMWENKIVQANIQKLKDFGYHFIEPQNGRLACGDEGVGKLAELSEILEKTIEVSKEEQQ